MIPMGFNGRKGRLLHAEEVPDGEYGVKRTWSRSSPIFVSVHPISRTQSPSDDGIMPDLQFRILFNLPKDTAVSPDDRVEVGSKVYRLTTVTDYDDTVNAVGVLL